MKKSIVVALGIIIFLLQSCGQDEWSVLFDGSSLDGWKASENTASWKIKDGALVTSGDRSHLFYTGELEDHDFRNFELSADVLTTPGSNSGIYFHTQYQDKGWPDSGYECQIINSSTPAGSGAYVEHKMTGSIYAIRNVYKTPVPDGKWFNYRIRVEGQTIRTYINRSLVAEYTEPENPYRPEGMKGRVLGSGTFALQCHDPSSEVRFKNIRVKPLADNLTTPGSPPEDLEFEKHLIDLGAANFPMIDLHVHLKGGLTEEQALAHARKYGFTYGIAVNCGLKMGYESDDQLKAYLDQEEHSTLCWHAMQAEGREWLELFSPENVKRFDYVFTDAMTWTNDNGKRMRLWIPEETEVGDPEDFMDQLVDRTVNILDNEPIDIYVNPSYLPQEIAPMYDELWTPERMDRVVEALVKNDIALEINMRRSIPSVTFIARAKAAGVKFTLGTNNAGAGDLGRMDYAFEVISRCNLSSEDMWVPGH